MLTNLKSAWQAIKVGVTLDMGVRCVVLYYVVALHVLVLPFMILVVARGAMFMA